MARRPFSGPLASTIARWMTTKPTRAKAAMKWTERADCRPPHISVSQGQAASMPGDMASPVTISNGSTANSSSA